MDNLSSSSEKLPPELTKAINNYAQQTGKDRAIALIDLLSEALEISNKDLSSSTKDKQQIQANLLDFDNLETIMEILSKQLAENNPLLNFNSNALQQLTKKMLSGNNLQNDELSEEFTVDNDTETLEINSLESSI